VVAALIIVGSARGRPKLARFLAGVGIVVVVMSLAVDRPAGLDEGNLDIQYQSVTASLLTGFWAQLVSGIVLILLAPILIRTLTPTPAGAGRRQTPDRSARARVASIRALGRRGAARVGGTAEAGR
jgi:hypothetical protein